MGYNGANAPTDGAGVLGAWVDLGGSVRQAPGGLNLNGGAGDPIAGQYTAMAIAGASGAILWLKADGGTFTAGTDPVAMVGGTTSGGAAKALVVGANRELLTYQSFATATITNPSVSTTSTQLLAANTGRRSFSIFNPHASAILYVKFGTSASTSSYTVQIAAGGYYESPPMVYTGVIHGIYAAVTATVAVTEGT